LKLLKPLQDARLTAVYQKWLSRTMALMLALAVIEQELNAGRELTWCSKLAA
jgi:hypothetical protein